MQENNLGDSVSYIRDLKTGYLFNHFGAFVFHGRAFEEFIVGKLTVDEAIRKQFNYTRSGTLHKSMVM